MKPENSNFLEGCLIDPSDARKVLNRAREIGVRIRMVLTTHHHWDHASGNGTIKEELPDAIIIGADSRVDHLDRLVKHEESWKVPKETYRTFSSI
jgi:glyoxylase-like metal-dependent hydrolase (beta-lactamase superfamily II)